MEKLDNDYHFWKAKNTKHARFMRSEEGADDYFVFVTNHKELPSVVVVGFYIKCGNCENYIKGTKFDMSFDT